MCFYISHFDYGFIYFLLLVLTVCSIYIYVDICIYISLKMFYWHMLIVQRDFTMIP
jgi:hypothetical protein